MRGWLGILSAVCLCASPLEVPAAEKSLPAGLQQTLQKAADWPGVIRSDLGVTRQGTAIPCVYSEEDLNLKGPKTRVLIIAGFDGNPAAAEAVLKAVEWFYTDAEAKPFRETLTISAVPLLNPDKSAAATFPPKGDAYFSKDQAEAEYVWRWIGQQAPDLVVTLSFDADDQWWTSAGNNHSAARLVKALRQKTNGKPAEMSARSLIEALMKTAPANTGTIPAIAAVRKTDDPRPIRFLKDLLNGIQQSQFTGPSPARKELQSRLDRSPVEIAGQLSKVYGHDLPAVQYIPALALVGRLWLGELTNDPSHRKEVQRIVAPYVAGEKTALPENFSGSHVAGHLIFSELAKSAENQDEKKRYLEMARKAAETGFDARGQMKEAMPAHNEMSDAVFMACPILVETGTQTGEKKYKQMALKHFRFMKERVLREDGIYRHSPLCEAAWGRGNGFPALGLAWCLTALDQGDPAFPILLKEFQNHTAALIKHQDPNGMWHQVIDDTGSYRELTGTAMITFAMIRGVRSGWLEEGRFRPVIEKAFEALKTRIAADGSLVDVCTGTGKQKTLRDYYDRKAILGRDARGGAMALLVTTEMARWLKE